MQWKGTFKDGKTIHGSHHEKVEPDELAKIEVTEGSKTIAFAPVMAVGEAEPKKAEPSAATHAAPAAAKT